MVRVATGRVDGSTIRLDEPVTSFDGRRVRVMLEPVEEPETSLSSEEQSHAWDEWARRGLQGPIEEDETELANE